MALLAWPVSADEPEAEPSPVIAILKGELQPDQSGSLGEKPGLNQLTQALGPEQRQAAVSKLRGLEGTNPGPQVLGELNEAYLKLGQYPDALRAANSLKTANPKSSEGYTRASLTLYEMKSFEKATEEAVIALKKNPRDRAALAAYKLSVGRSGTNVELPSLPSIEGKPEQTASSATDDSPDAAKLPLKPRQRFGKITTPPPLTASGTNSGNESSAPLWPLAGAGLLIGGGLAWGYAKREVIPAWLAERKRELIWGGGALLAAGAVYVITSFPPAGAMLPAWLGPGGGGAATAITIADGAVRAAGAVKSVKIIYDYTSNASADAGETPRQENTGNGGQGEDPGTERWGDPGTLDDHVRRHGPDFGAKNAADYVRKAVDFLSRADKEGFLRKIDKNGVLRIYDPKTNTFGSYNSNGTVKTYYKPNKAIHKQPTNMDYWAKQPGKPL